MREGSISFLGNWVNIKVKNEVEHYSNRSSKCIVLGRGAYALISRKSNEKDSLLFKMRA